MPESCQRSIICWRVELLLRVKCASMVFFGRDKHVSLPLSISCRLKMSLALPTRQSFKGYTTQDEKGLFRRDAQQDDRKEAKRGREREVSRALCVNRTSEYTWTLITFWLRLQLIAYRCTGCCTKRSKGPSINWFGLHPLTRRSSKKVSIVARPVVTPRPISGSAYINPAAIAA